MSRYLSSWYQSAANLGTTILAALIFFLAIVPIGLIRRLSGFRAIGLKDPATAEWQVVEPYSTEDPF